jgi:phosphatidyl-myo-inositol dimannoside synthase
VVLGSIGLKEDLGLDLPHSGSTVQEFAQPKRKIIGLFPELLGPGGVQEVGRMTAAALTQIAGRKDWSTDILSLNDPTGSHAIDFAGQTISFRGFGRAKLSFVLSSIGRARAALKCGPPIILAAHPHLAVPANLMRKVSPRAKAIVIAHGVEVWKPLPFYRRQALLRADLVLAPSRDTIQRLIDVQGVVPDRTRRLAWPLSPNFLLMADDPAGLTVPSAFPKKGSIILTVGRWASAERYKGADELIRAIPQLRASVPDVQLVAVGGGDDLPRLREIANSLGIKDRVHFLQNLSRDEVAACYAHADIFALPSTGEGFGLVFLEAMAFSKAVVGAACGGAIDLIEDGVNGLLLPPNDAGSLTAALNRLLCDEPLRTRLGRCGAEIVREKYRFDVLEAELEKICRDFMPREQPVR